MKCNTCGKPYDNSFADWTICRDCMRQQLPEGSYIDSIGICWTPEEVAEIGGISTIEAMCNNI